MIGTEKLKSMFMGKSGTPAPSGTELLERLLDTDTGRKMLNEVTATVSTEILDERKAIVRELKESQAKRAKRRAVLATKQEEFTALKLRLEQQLKAVRTDLDLLEWTDNRDTRFERAREEEITARLHATAPSVLGEFETRLGQHEFELRRAAEALSRSLVPSNGRERANVEALVAAIATTRDGYSSLMSRAGELRMAAFTPDEVRSRLDAIATDAAALDEKLDQARQAARRGCKVKPGTPEPAAL